MANWVKKQVLTAWQQGSITAQAGEIADELQIVLQEGLSRNKNNLLRKIFNSSDVRIKELQIELTGLEEVSIDFEKDGSGDVLIKNSAEEGYRYSVSNSVLENINLGSKWFWVYLVLSLITGIDFGDAGGTDVGIYLPAARTGFMLTKDIINKVGRNAVFNLAGTEQRDLSPFTRPINQFLDVMNDLTLDGRGDDAFGPIAEYLESGMAEGNVEISSLPNKEVSYVPSGQKKGLPLRVVSAVVTELSPLIFLQHINNMLCLSERKDVESICGKFGYTTNDLLNREQIKVYQLKSKSGGKTTVEELECGENGFVIPTFNDALDRILDEGYAIQE